MTVRRDAQKHRRTAPRHDMIDVFPAVVFIAFENGAILVSDRLGETFQNGIMKSVMGLPNLIDESLVDVAFYLPPCRQAPRGILPSIDVKAVTGSEGNVPEEISFLA